MRRLSRRSVALVTILVVLIGMGSLAWAQQFFGFGGEGRLPEGLIVPPKFPDANIEDGAFRVCKMVYTSVRREANGMGWSTDWPYAGIHLMIRTAELSKTRISKDRNGDPNHYTVKITDDSLFQCPFLTASDVGTIQFSTEEATRLHDYFLKGGFLWVDDFWGAAAWNQWSSQIHRVLPEFPIIDIPPDHPILHTLFNVTAVPQVPGINFFERTGGRTSERGAESAKVDFRGIADDHGRLMVVMTHNSDVSDSWEREGEDPEFFERFSPGGYELGVDVVLYSLTH